MFRICALGAFARFGVCVLFMVVDGTVPIITSDVAVHPHGFVVVFSEDVSMSTREGQYIDGKFMGA